MTAAMRSFFRLAPSPLLQLITSILLAPRPTTATPAIPLAALAGLSFDSLFARDTTCDGTLCGYNNQLCCPGGSACYTDTLNQAQCGAATAAVTDTGGYWQVYTTTYVETDLATITSVMSSYVGGAATVAAATATAAVACNSDLQERECGSICCASDQYCYAPGSCVAAAGGSSSAYYSAVATTVYTTTGVTAGAPVRPTSSTGIVVTSTQSPTVTVPFTAPIATGANVTLSTEEMSAGGGLSGGAIAGIVIGVLLALAILALVCFCCCVKGLLDGLLAIFGIGGRKRKRTTEVEEYERHSHRASGGGGRTWYGAAAPSRVSRYDERKEKTHEGRSLLGLGAGLAALWAILGLKRRRQERKNEERYSEYSDEHSSNYYTGTSESSASSDDRRTRDTRRSMPRR